MYCGANQLDDNASLISGNTVTVTYTGSKSVSGWTVINDNGEVVATGAPASSFSYTLNQNSYALCRLRNAAAADFSAFNTAYNYAISLNEYDYTAESYAELAGLLDSYSQLAAGEPTQIEVDNACYNLLTAVSHLVEATPIEPHTHTFEIYSFNNGVVTFRCSGCEATESVVFIEHINTGYEPLDIVDDGIVNAKDFAQLKRLYG
jgi:hypothetical protein